MTENKSADFESRNLKLIYFDDYNIYINLLRIERFTKEKTVLLSQVISIAFCFVTNRDFETRHMETNGKN